MVKLSSKLIELIEAKNFANIATLMPDGSPQITTVWVDHQDGIIIVNTAIGRQKEKNIRKDSRVALSIFDSNNPYNSVSIRGKVIEIREDGADEHIDKMAKKYIGQDKYPLRKPGERRIMLMIEPLHIFMWG